MKKLSILLTLLVTVAISYGQQDPQYTQYMYNMNVVNPAYAGSEGTLSIGLLGRTQWTGFPGSPKTLTFSVNAPIKDNMGLGLSAIVDKIGPVSEQNIYADFSYTVNLNYYSNLAFGLKAGATFQTIDFKSLQLEYQQDPLFTNNLNKAYPNFGAGVFYYTSRYYLGLSVPNLLRTRYFEKSNGKISRAAERAHIFLTTGYVFDISEDLKLKPHTMIKAVQGAPLSIDLSANVLIQNFLELGVGWRIEDSISGLVNVKATDNLRIGYAYDYTISNLGDYNNGSHEVFLLYNLDLSRGDLNSPRFF